MSNYQLIYTSSKRGYGVFSQSTEIRPDESRQITITTAYRRPQSLVNANEENLSKYPINLCRFKLANGKWVLAQSLYIGIDNTGRQGNFFTHALLFPKFSELTNEYLFYDFRKHLTEEEREQSNPSPLGTVTAPITNNESIKAFAKKNAPKVPLLIQAYLDAQKNRKKLIITDSNENTILWVKLLFDLLPKRLTEELEFTTYADRLTSAFDIVGVYDISVIRDTSRTVVFNGKDYDSEISELAKSLADDYINNDVNLEFMFFSSFMKSSELLSNIHSLYETLNSKSVDIDEIFDLLRGIPAKDKSISDSVIEFVTRGNYLNQFNPSQIEYLLRVTSPSENTSAYHDFIYQIAFYGDIEKLDILNKSLGYSRELVELFNNKEMNINTQYFLLNSGIKKNFGRFSKSEVISLLQLAEDINRQKKDWILIPISTLVDQIIEFFPYESYQDTSQTVLESDLYDIIKDINRLVGSEVISGRTSHYVKKAIQSSTENDQFSLILRNVSLVATLINEMREVVKHIRGLDTKEQSQIAERILYLLYIGLTNSRIQENLLRESYNAMYPVVQMLFDLKPYYGQKKLLRTYSDLVTYGKKGASFVFKKNYLLYSIIASVVALIILGTGFFTVINSPEVTLIEDSSITIRSLFFPQELNTESDILIAFPESSEEVLKVLADDVRSKYTLKEGYSFDQAEIIVEDNEIRYIYSIRNARGSFFVSFDIPEDIDLQSSPKILIDGVETSGLLREFISFSDIYDVSIDELIKSRIGEITISDSTIEYFRSNVGYNRLFDLDKYSSGILLTSPDLTLVDLEVLNVNKLEVDKNKIDINNHEISIVVTNALGKSTSLDIRFSFQPSLVNIPLEEFIYFDKLEFQIPYARNTKDVIRTYLNYNGIDFSNWDSVDAVLNDEKDSITLSGINGLNFKSEIPVSLFIDEESPRLNFLDGNKEALEFDWPSLKDNGSQAVIEKISELIGEFEILDDSLRTLEQSEYLLTYISDYSNTSNLLDFDHPLFTISTNIDSLYPDIQSGLSDLSFRITIRDRSNSDVTTVFNLVLPATDSNDQDTEASEGDTDSSTTSSDENNSQETNDDDQTS